MAKRYKESEVITMLKKQVDAKKMLFMPNCGCGLTAKLQEKGGADLICVSATSYWRMKGQGSLAPLMPTGAADDAIGAPDYVDKPHLVRDNYDNYLICFCRDRL